MEKSIPYFYFKLCYKIIGNWVADHLYANMIMHFEEMEQLNDKIETNYEFTGLGD